ISQLRDFAKALSHYLSARSDLEDSKALQDRVLKAEARIDKLQESPVTQVMVQSVVGATQTIVDPRDKSGGDRLPDPELSVRVRTLTTGEKQPVEVVQAVSLSQEERQIEVLLKALKEGNREEARKIISLFSDPQKTSKMVEKVLEYAFKKEDLVTYSLVFSEIVKLSPYMNIPVEAEVEELTQDEIERGIDDAWASIESGMKKNFTGAILSNDSLQEFFTGLKNKLPEKEQEQGLKLALERWASDGNYKLLFQALNELETHFFKDKGQAASFIKTNIESLADSILQAVAKKKDPKEYYTVLQMLGTVCPDVGRFIFHNEKGYFQPESITLM